MKIIKIGAVLFAIILVVTMLPIGSVHAVSSSEIRNQINQLKKEQENIQKEIEEIEKEYEKTYDEIADIISQKNIVDQEIQLLHQQITNINEQMLAYNVLIADKQDELDAATDTLTKLKSQSKTRIRAMEENGQINYWAVIFKAHSFSDLLDKFTMIQEIAAMDKMLLAELNSAAEKIKRAQDELELGKEELSLTKEELDSAEEAMELKRKEAENLLQELLSKAEDLEALKADFQQQEQKFLDEIAAKENEFNEAKKREWEAYMATYVPPTTAPPATNPNNPPSDNSPPVAATGWIKPCNYVMLTSPFGYRKSPTAGASTYHQGVDLAGPTGTPIVAASSGVVAAAGYNSVAGNYVKITHPNGFSSVYMHLHTIHVSSGAVVGQGQQIGTMGSTGVSTGPHLHFGIAKDGTYVNPANYISF